MTLNNFLQKIKSVLTSITRSMQEARMKQVEQYLAQSQNLADLEKRQKFLEDYWAGRRHML